MVARKIIIVANSDLTFDQRLQRIASSLDLAGYQVSMLGRSFHHSVALPSANYPQSRIALYFQKGKLAYLELNIRLFFKLLQEKYDGICSVDLDTLPACWLAKKVKGGKLIHDAHEYMEQVPEVYHRPVTRWVWGQIAKSMLPAADLCYTVSQSLVEEFRKKYNVRFGLVRNIALLESDDPAIETAEKQGYWVFLGAVNQGRGLEEFLEVLPATNRKLVVLGTGDVLDKVKEKAERLLVSDQVIFKGKVPPAEARAILRHAWAGINLLTDEGLSYRFSLANKFFDYVQAGIPQICIAFPEYEKLNKEYPVAVLTRLEINALRAATEVISLPEKQHELRAAAALARHAWNWEKEAENLIRMYDVLFRISRNGLKTKAF